MGDERIDGEYQIWCISSYQHVYILRVFIFISRLTYSIWLNTFPTLSYANPIWLMHVLFYYIKEGGPLCSCLAHLWTIFLTQVTCSWDVYLLSLVELEPRLLDERIRIGNGPGLGKLSAGVTDLSICAISMNIHPSITHRCNWMDQM